jgi:TolA-binding protein
MLKAVILSLFFIYQVASAASIDQRRAEILRIVDEELSEVSRLAQQQDFRSPDTILRISELNLEKARLWKEVENEKYLSIDPDQRRNIDRKSYFKKSEDLFDNANKYAQMVVQKFPNYKDIGEVYYILAYNHKELGKYDDAQKYFKLAAGKTNPNSQIAFKSKLALADSLYNSHKYEEAIPLYEASLSKIKEKWWTKDAFNLAWCYYRTKNYDRAISLMKEIYSKSGDPKFINMKNSVERDIGIFYVDANKVDEAVKFYNSVKINYTEQFIKIASAVITQGKFAQADLILEKAAKFEKDRDRKILIYLTQLDLFDKYGKIESHLEVSKALLNLHQQKALNEDDFKKFSFHVNKKAAELQKTTASDTYKEVPKVRKLKAEQSIAYFEIASQLNPSEKAEKIFFKGETSYAAEDFSKALDHYIQSFDLALSTKDKKILAQSLEGMLSSLSQKGMEGKVGEKFYVPVYTRYLAVDKKSDRASSIYLKLFNTQVDKSDYAGAEKTLSDFSVNFSDDYKTQEGMLAKIMEHYRQKKDYAKIKNFVSDINSGKYKVSKKYADALRSLMTKIQIEGVQQSLEKGQKDVALRGYHQIYESTESTPKAKTNAAYNLAVLYYELGDALKSHDWAIKAVQDMDNQDVFKFSDSLLSIAAGYFLKQNFEQSADLSQKVLMRLCKQNSSNKNIAFKNAVFISLANGDLDNALEIKAMGKDCMLPDQIISEVSFELLKDLQRSKSWERYEKEVSELEINSKNWPLLIKPVDEIRKVYLNLGDTSRANEFDQKIWKFYNQSKAQKLEIPVEALDLISFRLLGKVAEMKQKISQVKLQFPENDFNNILKKKLQQLDQLSSQVNEIQKTGSGRGIVDAYKYVIEAYEELGNEVKNFTPGDKSPEYVATFKKAMEEVYRPLLASAQKFRGEIRKLISDNKILSMNNFSVIQGTDSSYKRYRTIKEAVLMDRGGKR